MRESTGTCTPSPQMSPQQSCAPVVPQQEKEFVHVDVTVFPGAPPLPPPPPLGIPEAWLKIMAKYKFPWRIVQLAQPRTTTKKFVRKSDKVKPRKWKRLRDEIRYYAEQMSQPGLRMLYYNLKTYKSQKKLQKHLTKRIRKAWGSIYNYYKKKEEDRRIRAIKRQQFRQPKKKKLDLTKYDVLATPKKVPKPPPLERKPKKIFSNSNLVRLDEIAAPKQFIIEPPKSFEVSPAALTYEPTENILKMSKIPERYAKIPKPKPEGVSRSALRYKATERVEKLAIPKQRHDKAKVDEDYNPWAISKNALKYKPTRRIIELAKPLERD